MRSVICTLPLVLLASTSLAQIDIALPLDGYYRAGHYMPVQVSVRFHEAPDDAALTISTGGELATVLPLAAGYADAVVPLLVPMPAGEVTAVASHAPGQPAAAPLLRELQPAQRLIAFTTIDTDVATDLFPGRAVVAVRVDPALPLRGDAAAWEVLDGLLLDAATAGRLEEDRLAGLLAAGIAVAVHAADPPHPHWPWERMGEHWILRHEAAGPSAAVFSEAAYLPTLGWWPERPASFRRQVLLSAILFTLIAMSVAFLPRRHALVGLAGVSLIAIIGLGLWRRGHPPLLQAGGGVIVTDRQIAQHDRWSYQAALAPVDAAFPWTGLTRPIFAGPAQLADLPLSLRCGADGTPRSFVYTLRPQMQVAFVSRSIGMAQPVEEPSEPLASPLLPLVRQLYLRRDDQIAGEIEAAPNWPTIIITRPD